MPSTCSIHIKAYISLITGDFVKCGGSKLVHSTFWCDGWPECTDNHADELNCNYPTFG